MRGVVVLRLGSAGRYSGRECYATRAVRIDYEQAHASIARALSETDPLVCQGTGDLEEDVAGAIRVRFVWYVELVADVVKQTFLRELYWVGCRLSAHAALLCHTL